MTTNDLQTTTAPPGRRTCVGCGGQDDPAAMIRLVVEGGEVAVDLRGSAFGRGARVHARPQCIAAAPRGLARALSPALRTSPRDLGHRLVEAGHRRLDGLLLSARRAGAASADARIARETRRVRALIELGKEVVGEGNGGPSREAR